MLGTFLRMNLDGIKILVKGKDFDWVFLLDGPERGGKSFLATLIQQYWNMFDNPMENLEYTVWTFDKLKEVAKNAPKGTGIVFHESGIYGRNYKNKINMEMIKVFTTIGAKNLFFIFTFPSFHMLDPYLRYHRIRTRGYVYTKKGNRGFVRWYVRPPDPWEDGHSLEFIKIKEDRYTEDGINKELWEEVQIRDTAFKQNILES